MASFVDAIAREPDSFAGRVAKDALITAALVFLLGSQLIGIGHRQDLPALKLAPPNGHICSRSPAAHSRGSAVQSARHLFRRPCRARTNQQFFL